MLPLLTNMPKDVLIAQLKDGLVLLVLGMGTVFVFLVILIFATKLMSRIIMNMEGRHHDQAPAAAPALRDCSCSPSPQGRRSCRASSTASGSSAGTRAT